ncbi:MAG TPA: mannosyltransferase family protein [Vicinamibacterales bacterium]|nr:mannosyltransferase family protein [Vicinamibacterales bacterium]
MSPRAWRIGSVCFGLDVVAVLALLLGATVFVTGGFREWLPWGRVSLTSWERPVIVAFIAIAARHWLQPRPTILARLADWWRAIAATPGVRPAVPVVLTTRTGVLLVGFLAVALFGYRPDVPVPWRVYENEILNLPARWDTGWYMDVANSGYRWTPSRITQQQNIAFFPAYPMLMRYGSLFLGRELMWTGVLISWVSFFAAMVYLYRFTRERFGDDAARVALALLASYPFAVYFSTAYTESLFLLTVVGACYHFERNQLWRAGAWALLAGLSRPNGCLLSIVLGLIAVRPLWPFRFGGMRLRDWMGIADRLAVAALPGLGMLIYSTYIFFLTGHPLQWAMQNAAWGRVYRGLDVLFTDQATTIGGQGLYTYAATRTVDVFQLSAVAFVCAALWPVLRRIGLPYAVMIAINVLPPLMMGGLLSIGRVTSVMFPVFVWLAVAVPIAHRAAWVAGFAMLQAIAAAMFFTWRPLY